MHSTICRLLTIVSLLLAFSSSNAAADRPTVPACSEQSYNAFLKLTTRTAEEVGCPAMQMGIVEHDVRNPMVSLAPMPSRGTLDKGALDDPSCGLGEAVQFCSAGVPAKNRPLMKDLYLTGVFCDELQRVGILPFQISYTHQSFLVVFRKMNGGWLLIQDLELNWDARISVLADGTLQIDELWNTSHRIFHWNGNGFVPAEEWHTVFVWDGKKFKELALNRDGEFRGATPNCSIAATRKATLATDEQFASEEKPPQKLDQNEEALKLQTPVLRLRCQKFIGRAGVAMLFSLADWPSVGDEWWNFAVKAPGSSWTRPKSDSDWECLETLDSRGFTTNHQMLSVQHPQGCPSSGSCFRHGQWEWNGKEFAPNRTWYSGPQEPSAIAPLISVGYPRDCAAK